MKSDADAADIVQAASVKAFHDIDNPEEASQFGGYLRTLVLAWRHGNYGDHRPDWVKHDAIAWSERLYIVLTDIQSFLHGT